MESKIDFYESAEDFLGDIDLIVANAKTYNGSDSVYYKEAYKLSCIASKLLSKEIEKTKSLDKTHSVTKLALLPSSDEQEEVDILQEDDGHALMKRTTDGRIFYSSLAKEEFDFKEKMIHPLKVAAISSEKPGVLGAVDKGDHKDVISLNETKTIECRFVENSFRSFQFDSYSSHLSKADYNTLCCLAGSPDSIAYLDSLESFIETGTLMEDRMKRKITQVSDKSYEYIKRILTKTPSYSSSDVSQRLAELYRLQKARMLAKSNVAEKEVEIYQQIKEYFVSKLGSNHNLGLSFDVSNLIDNLIEGNSEIFRGTTQSASFASNRIALESMFSQ